MIKIAYRRNHPTHRVVWDKLWELDRTACSAPSLRKYTVSEGTHGDVTCQRCLSATV